MPRLTRLRFVSVGHPDARLDDFTIDLRDADGRATDSTLWLRNGGGKSSILTLFFALLRPDRREFLGAKAEARKRRLDDYILRDDRSVVACEWELDHGDRLDFSGETQRYITGVFYEWRTGPAEEDRLRRLFFAARPSPDDPRLTLEGIPLFIAGNNGRANRRNLAGFRAEWMALRELNPHLEVSSTENQREWADVLENAGIDPELFGYQIRMNQREGGADELFRFDDHEKFVDFLLELALDPSMGECVGRNVATYRRELTHRRSELIPERELALGLVERLLPAVRISEQRSELTARTDLAGRALVLLRSHLDERIAALAAEENEQRELLDREQHAAEQAQCDAGERKRLAAGLRRIAAELRHRKAVEDLGRDQTALENATRELALWEAAAPLYAALRHERNARDYEEQLARNQEEFAPLLTRLRAAANGLGAALQHRLLEARRQMDDDCRAEREARASAQEDRSHAAEAAARAAAARVEIRRLEEWLETARRERDEIAVRGEMLAGETGTAAIERLDRSIGDLEQRVASLTGEILIIRRRQGAFREEKERAVAETRAAEERAAACERRFEEAKAERSALEQLALLRPLLEVESVDLERLPDRAVVQLRDAAHALLERVVTLRMDRAEDERALAHLEDNGLLPPARDTQKVLDALRAKLPAVWSGWAYIENNTPDDNEARRRLVQQNAALAAGVIVRDSDFEKACELLDSDASVTPETPVTVAPASVLHRNSAPVGKVVGPASSAFYNRAEGRAERIRRRSRFDAAEEAIRREEDQRQEIESLINRLQDFRRRYPRGWFADQEAALTRDRETADGWARRAQHLAAEEIRVEEEIARLESANKAAEIQCGRLRSARERVEQFVRQFERDREARSAEAEVHRLSLAAAEHEQSRLNEEAVRLDRTADSLTGRTRDAAAEVARVEQQFSAVEYLTTEPEAVPGSVDALKDRYSHLKAEYEHQIGAGDLQRLRQDQLEQAAEQRRKFEALRRPDIEEAAVRSVLDTLPDASRVDVRLRLAREEANAVSSRIGQQKNVEKAAQAELEQAILNAVSIGEPPDLHAADAREADERASAAEFEQRALEAQSAQHDEQVRITGRRIEDCVSQGRALHKDLQRLEMIYNNSAELLNRLASAVSAESIAGWTPPASDEDCDRRIGELDRDLREARQEHKSLDSQRQNCATGIRAWVQRPGRTQTAIATRFGSAAENELEANAAAWAEELNLRVETIDAQLAEINQHRDLLIDETLAAAEEALSLLRAAHNCSRLPDHVPGLGGTQFLRIHDRAPEETGERRGRIGALIDDLAEAGEIPPGLALVQLAVRRLARPIRVKVLHPDPDSGRKAVDIVDLARFSGGEQLTAAILLYCSLAQLRARSRGRGRSSSSVLVLDNPIGRASRVRFLELQREVARAMGIQLFYTTGVEDLEALRTLPNVIRVRNSRLDRNTGHHVLEHDATRLEVARIVRTE
jgi:hypothetical protein